MKDYFKFVKYDAKHFLANALFIIIMSVTSSLSLYFMADAVDLVPKGEVNRILYDVVIIAALQILSLVSMKYGNKNNVIFLKNVGLRMKYELVESIMNKPYDEYSSQGTSDYLSIIKNDVGIVVDNYCDQMFNVIEYTLRLIVSTVVILKYSIVVGVVTIIYSMFNMWLNTKHNERLSDDGLSRSNGENDEVLALNEGLNNFVMYHSNNALPFGINRMKLGIKKREEANMNYLDNYLRVMLYLSINSSVGQKLMWILALCLVVTGRSDIGLLVIIQSYASTFMNGVRALMSYVQKMASTKGVRDKVKSIINICEEDDREDICALETIKLRNISFKYDSNEVITNFSHEFVKNGKYIIIGESGKGKSTLLKLIIGFLTPSNGSILINDKDLSNYSQNSYLSNVTYISQDTTLLNDTIKNNILLGSECNEEQLLNVLRKSCLDEWVNTLDEGMDTIITENATNISGGQKQRIAIARALYHNKDILLLDEATSALDKETAIAIENNLFKDESLTIVMVTHHLLEQIKAFASEIIEL